MNICPICKKELVDYNREVCKNCLQFYKWKYKKKWKKELQRALSEIERETLEDFDDNLNSQGGKK